MSNAFSPDELPGVGVGSSVGSAVGGNADAQVAPDSSAVAAKANIGPVVAGPALLLDMAMLAVWMAMTDYLIYRVGTYLTWGLCLIGTLLFLALAKRQAGHRFATVCMTMLLALLAVKLLWCGSLLQIVCGLFVALCLAMARSGLPPFLPEVLAFVGMVIAGAARRVSRFRFGSVSEVSGTVRPWVGSSILLPATLVLCFIGLFVMANPDVASSLAVKFRLLADSTFKLLAKFSFGEAVFVFASGWMMLGLLYPSAQKLMSELVPAELSTVKSPSKHYPVARNTVVSLNVLFALYLVFEFATLWFRELPDDFYYAGYAHQGAFWLTVALALSTLILSAIFRGSLLSDPSLSRLKKIALVWSAMNMLLAVAVYNRLFIYIDFNGMTRMRVVGLLGIACVVAGLLLVVVKFWRDRDFVWLIHRQLWVPVLAVISYAIIPVDWIVHEVNVRRVLEGKPASSVQIVAHLHSAEGALPLLKLVDHPDPIIRDGVRALLALWAHELNATPDTIETDLSAYRGRYRPELGHTTPWLWVETGFSHNGRKSEIEWHNWQGAESRLRGALLEVQEAWQPFADDSTLRDRTVDAFYEYAYKWY
jgi:hypothetical protein